MKTKRKTKLTSLLLALCMVIAMLPTVTIDLTAFAAETASTDPSEDWEYTVNDDGTVTLTKYAGSAADVYIPSTVTDADGNRLTVTALGEGVFKGNTGINSATFGEGITTIGASAFEGAINLVCIVSPETLATIGDRAFYGCSAFNSVILYDAVTSIGTDAFAGCPNVTVWVNENSAAHTYTVENGIKYEIMNADAEPEIYVIDDVEYYIQNGEAIVMGAPDEKTGELVIPATVNNYPVTRITDSAFNGSQLTKINLPDTINVLGDSAFANTSLLESINIPNGVTEIPGSLLHTSSVSAAIDIPDGVKTIGGWAFYKCSNLSSITIPEGVETICTSALDTTALKEIVIPHSVKTVQNYAFANNSALIKATILSCDTVIGYGAFASCYQMTTLAVPEGSKQLQTLDGETNWHIFYKCNSFSNIETTIEGWVQHPFFVCKENTKWYPASYDPVNWNLYVDGKLVTDIVVPDGITEIAENSFRYCNNTIKSLTIPRSVKKIGQNAFPQTTITDYYLESDGTVVVNTFINATPKNIYTDSWKSLSNFKYTDGTQYPTIYKTENLYINGERITEYVVPENQTETGVFGAWLEKITLHDKVTKIGDYSFQGCTKLKEINIPDSVTHIGKSAFSNCTSLETIELSDNIKSIGAYAFSGCVMTELVIPDSITEIPDYAFQRAKIENLYLPKEITYIGHYAFRYAELENVYIDSYDVFSQTTKSEYAVLPLENAQNLYVGGILTDTFVVPEGMKVITPYFKGGWLKKIVLNNAVTEIGEYAFSGSSNLSEIVWSDGVMVIGHRAFAECPSLKKVTIPEGVIAIGDYAFFSSGVTELTVSGTVQTIGDSAFSSCVSLEKIEILDGVKVLGYAAFNHCTALKEVKLADSITEIGHVAFTSALISEFTFPKNVTVINQEIFNNCKNLKKIVIPEGATTINGFLHQKYCASGIEVYMPKSVTTITENWTFWPYASQMKWYVYDGSYVHKFAELNKFTYEALPDDSETEIDISHLTYTISNEEVTITKCDTAYMGILEIPAEIEGYPVKHIGNSSFYNCTNITNIILSEGIETIENWAFTSCDALETINLPGTLKTIGTGAFWGCGSLGNVVIPEGVTTLGAQAFQKCRHLSSITLPDSITKIEESTFEGCEFFYTANLGNNVTSIGVSAFKDCENLSTINIPQTVTYIGAEAFYNCADIKSLALPEGLTCIYNHTFYGTSSLADINLPKSLVSIGDAVFQRSGIKSVVIPEGVTTISPSLFSGCTSLESVALHEGITDIYGYAFYGCSALPTLELPDGLKTIGDSAFAHSSKLSEITIPEGISTLGTSSFAGTAIKNATIPEAITNVPVSLFNNCASLESITLHDNTTSIGDSAFNNCIALTRVKLSKKLNSIGANAFNGCGALLDIDIPDSVTTIGAAAFKNCTNASLSIPKKLTSMGDNTYNNCDVLADIIIPANITAIPDFAFANCDNLRKIIVHDNVTSIGEHSFMSSSKAILWVYEGSSAHTYAQNNDVMYFVMHKTGNPEIAYGAGISGTVTAGGAPVSGAEVSLLYDDGVVKETVTTDDTGAYAFTYAEVGAYTVRATDTSGNSAAERVSVKRMNAFDVFLTGETDIVLKSAWTVSGNVSPASATVTLTDTDGNIIESVDVTDGTYSFENIPNGSYIIKAETESGSAVKEITVFNGDVAVEDITVSGEFVKISGDTVIDRKGKDKISREWVEVTLYNMDGAEVEHVQTGNDGEYSFSGVPVDDYVIVAKATEMHEGKKEYNHPHMYAGFAYISPESAGEYTVDTIVLKNGDEKRTGVTGKVTANGEHQACEVVMVDIFGNEEALSRTTGKNGRYEFGHVADGVYIITATTESNGVGFTVIGVIGGVVYGETDIRIYKDEKVKERENSRHDRIPHCSGRDDAVKYRDKIAEEKRWYDGLSPKKKKHCSKEYIEWLKQLIEWITEYECEVPEGAELSGGSDLFSEEELKDEESAFKLTLEITEASPAEIGSDGIQTGEQFIQQSIEDTAEDKTIAGYYNISLSKTDSRGKHEIKSIARDTDTTGKVRITMSIPEEYRGHKHYHFVHIHNGEPKTLVDLDNNPDTITFEVDRFSTFALTYTDEVLSVDGEVEEVLDTKKLILYNLDPYNDESGNTIYRVGLFAGIDSLDYKEVGYEITCVDDGKSIEVTSTNVFSSVSYTTNGTDYTRTPDEFGSNCKYIFGFVEGFSNKYISSTFKFRPFAVDTDGKKIYGEYAELNGIYTK